MKEPCAAAPRLRRSKGRFVYCHSRGVKPGAKQVTPTPKAPTAAPASMPNAICRFRAMANPRHANMARIHNDVPKPASKNKRSSSDDGFTTGMLITFRATIGIAVKSKALRKLLMPFRVDNPGAGPNSELASDTSQRGLHLQRVQVAVPNKGGLPNLLFNKVQSVVVPRNISESAR